MNLDFEIVGDSYFVLKHDLTIKYLSLKQANS